MKRMHGGDRYSNNIELDFSVNTNPLGMPESVKNALVKAVDLCEYYPDLRAGQLKSAVADMHGLSPEFLLFGNGASELFMAIVHAVSPKRALLFDPSFSGYEYALQSVECDIVHALLKQDEGFAEIDSLTDFVSDEQLMQTDLIFVANPNNPTGQAVVAKSMRDFLEKCRKHQVTVVVDECFADFCEIDISVLPWISQYDNLVVVRAFTKNFAIAGVRLGYAVCTNAELRKRIERHLPEWNLSVLAQEAGIACANEQMYLHKTVELIKKEKAYLTEKLTGLGIKVYPSDANFLLIYSEKALYDLLLSKGILIRDCADFGGLSKGYYRIAVRMRQENDILVKVMGECLATD